MNELNSTQAKYLEYAIYMFRKMCNIPEKPTYQVVWKFDNNSLIAGNFLERNGNSLVTKELDASLDPVINRNNVLAPYSLAEFRAEFFGHFSKHGNWNSAYESPAELLEECILFINKLQRTSETINLVKLKNVEFLASQKHLDFLLLDPKARVKPVSLISVSKN